MAKRVLSIDIETFSDVDLTNCGVYRYIEGDFHILLFAYAFDDEDVQCVDLACGEKLPQAVVNAIFDDSIIKSAWNAQFERTCLSKYFGTQLSPDSWQCTMVWAASLSLPLKLKLAAQVLKTGEQKDDTGERLIRYFSIPCKPTKSNSGRTRNLPKHAPKDWQTFKSYCIQDVRTERDIRKRLERFPLLPQEWDYYHMDQRINDRGVLIDKELVQQAIICDMMLSEEMTKRAYALTGLENPNSVSQLKGWLEERGISVDSLGKKDVASLIADLNKHSIDSDALDMMKLRLQMAKSSVKKYQAAERCICDDGRAHGLFQFSGANRTQRWAGRLIQLQNLPQNHISTLDEARELVKMGCFDMIETLYGNTPDILSQLIRTMLIPKEGCEFIVADFSAIEARVLAWLAGEQWVLDAFENGKDLYCATASQMFGVPVVKHGINSDLRQKGKISVLACGYGGGVGALISMGALDMGLKESELPDIISSWRDANPNIVKFWYAVEKAAIETVKDHQDRTVGKIGFQFSANTLWIVLPSGRRLAYIKPKLQPNRFGRMALTFEGLGANNKWTRGETYRGKLVENCIAKGTLVLTHRGLIPIEDIKINDLIWDGIEWVHHGGLLCKGIRSTVEVVSSGERGIHMTPEHKILTKRGWVRCYKADGFNWADVSLPDCYTKGGRYSLRQNTMVMPMCLWKRSSCRRRGFEEKEVSDKIMRMHEQKAYQPGTKKTWYVQASCMGRLAFNETTMPRFQSSGLSQLWRQGHNSLRALAGKFREFLERYGFNMAKRAGYRQDRQQQRVQPGELQMDNKKSQYQKQTQQSDRNNITWNDDCRRTCRKIRNWRNNTVISHCKWVDGRLTVNSTGCEEYVYDIRNCGTRHRFAVWDPGAEKIRIVSNCTQATARDILVEAMKRLEDAGLDIVGHVHDEVILEVPKGSITVDEVCSIMNQNPKWAAGLPLASDGYTGNYYFKS